MSRKHFIRYVKQVKKKGILCKLRGITGKKAKRRLLFALTHANPYDTIIMPRKGWDEELTLAWRLAPSFPKGGDGVASDFYLPCLEVYGDYHDP